MLAARESSIVAGCLPEVIVRDKLRFACESFDRIPHDFEGKSWKAMQGGSRRQNRRNKPKKSRPQVFLLL